MTQTIERRAGTRARLTLAGAAALAAAALAGSAVAQPRGGQAQPPQSPRAGAPVDLTGYWVAVVSEDWRHRMATPRKGDYESVPLNGEGRRVAGTWDLDADNAAGNQCRAFGVGGIMRQPGRMHITWADDDTLKVDFDAGTQTRLMEFAASAAAPAEKTWQGFSRADWQRPPQAGNGPGRAQIGNSTGPIAPGGGGRGQRGGPASTQALSEGGALHVVTSNFRGGYLRKNGVPYSEDAKITEYFHRLPDAPNGDVWLHVVTLVEDPKYLNDTFYTSAMFKLEKDGSKFKPSPCRTAPPPGGSP
ncbi:MAG TPA: hypothetical protein VFX89_01540 [Gammaproteobacteria bacterium]|nr:hypothetical protein [Gammaproteobacteria bacterium]